MTEYINKGDAIELMLEYLALYKYSEEARKTNERIYQKRGYIEIAR